MLDGDQVWHGARWSFVVWGLLNGMYQIIGSLMRRIVFGSKSTFDQTNAASIPSHILQALVIVVAVLVVVVLGVWGNAYNAQSFIYFQF